MRKFSVCGGIFLLAGIATAHAQTADPARAAAIIGDKSGKYVAIDTDQAFVMHKGWFSAMHCAKPDTGFVHLRIGAAHFRVPQDSLDGVLAGALVMENNEGKFRAWHEADTGCSDHPLEAVRADIAPPASRPADDLVLRITSPNAAAFRQTLLQLRDHPDGNCAPVKTSMVVCTGSFNNVLTSFLLVKDAAMAEESGAPLHLRCTTIPVTSCGVEDDLDSGVTFQTAFPATDVRDIEPARIADLYEGVRKAVAGLKVAN